MIKYEFIKRGVNPFREEMEYQEGRLKEFIDKLKNTYNRNYSYQFCLHMKDFYIRELAETYKKFMDFHNN